MQVLQLARQIPSGIICKGQPLLVKGTKRGIKPECLECEWHRFQRRQFNWRFFWEGKLKKALAVFGLAIIGMIPGTILACTFNYKVYADSSINKRIDAEIGSKVTDEYCRKYNKNYQIVIIAQAYMNESGSLGHSIVGLRKRGTDSVPANSRAGYRYKSGNFAISTSYDLAALSALDNLVDVMADLEKNLN